MSKKFKARLVCLFSRETLDNAQIKLHLPTGFCQWFKEENYHFWQCHHRKSRMTKRLNENVKFKAHFCQLQMCFSHASQLDPLTDPLINGFAKSRNLVAKTFVDAYNATSLTLKNEQDGGFGCFAMIWIKIIKLISQSYTVL